MSKANTPLKKINSILLIEDDEITASVYKLLLDDLNVCDEVIVKQDGEEGVNYLLEVCTEANCPNLIFIDVKLPDKSGFEVLEELESIKDKLTNSKIFILSSSSFSKDISTAKKYGIEDYVFKPLSKEKIYDIMQKHFN